MSHYQVVLMGIRSCLRKRSNGCEAICSGGRRWKIGDVATLRNGMFGGAVTSRNPKPKIGPTTLDD